MVDAGDLETSETDYGANRRMIKEAVASILEAGARPLVIGGDDSVPIPVFRAYEGRGNFTILQIDGVHNCLPRDQPQGFLDDGRLGRIDDDRDAGDIGFRGN